MATYEPVIGLEVHAELLTESKMFCPCAVVDATSAAPNQHICPVCTAQPGALPVINRQAVEYAMMVGLALNCQINRFNQFSRKSYFYPDLPKGYQITQYEHPIASNGWLDIEVAGSDGQVISKRIGIRRAHMEEDTGKSTHVGDASLVDLNRAGVPLLEIVSEPDFRSVEEIEAYARKLRSILQYLGVNHGDMSKGVLRFEANVSVREAGSNVLNTRTEIKNLNSIRSMVRASRFEIARQTEVYENGGEVKQQTLGFNEVTGETRSQRSKETASDYRYFPEPDLPPLMIDPAWVDELRAKLPELPDAKRGRFVTAFGLSEDDAAVLVSDKAIADYYETGLKAKGDPQKLANWITIELFRYLNEANLEITDLKVGPAQLVALINMVEDGQINNNTAKDVLAIMLEDGREAAPIVEEKGWGLISDTSELEAIIDNLIEGNPDPVHSYLGGKEGLLGWFIGQVMKETKGQADAALVRDLFAKKFDTLREQS
ncbi:MAG: Asp-tRNA(Asn)/Glu-tRNA(Gln) amidotransferase subunit GatB [Chloroflexi bacterium]|nr:Asp-tRNA(Asn)/Glu-tRNA(Gln) amidotransferase subunit GatB [Chloroflexota bacterium]